MTSRNRPLSPHLQVYKLGLTGYMSITHRITGVGLALGTLLLAYWLGSAAAGPEAFATASAVIGSPIGYLLMFGWSAALFYHLCNGVRHLLWDIGWGYQIAQAEMSGKVALVCAAALTVVTWLARLAA